MAFIDLTNFKDWPMGGMLQYELKILPYLCDKYDVDLWGVSVDGNTPHSININGRKYSINIWGHAKTTKRIIPNYLKGIELFKFRKKFHKYDIIYAHTASCLYPFFSYKKNGVEIVYHQHGLMYLDDNSLKTKIQKPFMKKAQEKSNVVFVVSGSKSVKNYSEKIDADGKLISIKSPISIGKLNEESVKEKLEKSQPNRFIYTGRLTRFKNVSTLIPIFKKYVSKIDSNAILTIIGDGEEFNLIKELISKNNLTKNIILTGKLPHSEIKNKLLENDIFLMPSNGEGVSVSVAEANSFGLPVVSFNVPGLKEQVISGISGYIANNTNEDFYQKMLQVRNEWKKLVKSSFEYSQNFKAEKVAEKIIRNI